MRNSMKLHGYIDEQFREYPLLSLLIWTLVGVLAAYCLAFPIELGFNGCIG